MKNSKGVLTLEVALVMPIVIYTVFLMIFVSLLMYTRLYIGISVNHAATIATNQWYDSNSAIYTENNSSFGVIANAIGTIGASNIKTKNIEDLIRKRINSAPMNIINSQVEVNASNYLIYQKLDIDVKCTYKPPLSGLFALLGLSEDGTVSDSFSKDVKLSSTEENMRMISYINDAIKRGSFDKVLDKISSILKGGK